MNRREIAAGCRSIVTMPDSTTTSLLAPESFTGSCECYHSSSTFMNLPSRLSDTPIQSRCVPLYSYTYLLKLPNFHEFAFTAAKDDTSSADFDYDFWCRKFTFDHSYWSCDSADREFAGQEQIYNDLVRNFQCPITPYITSKRMRFNAQTLQIPNLLHHASLLNGCASTHRHFQCPITPYITSKRMRFNAQTLQIPN